MTSYEYWKKLVAENPEWADENAPANLTVGELRTKLTMAHLEGCEYMKERMEADKPFPDILKSVLEGVRVKR